LRVVQDALIRESDYANSSRVQEFGSPLVVLAHFRCLVLNAVEFDGKSSLVAVEVNDIGIDGVLTPEFETAKSAIAQQRPEELFGIGMSFAEIAREVE
jgi:hypothetical protein